MVPLLQLLTWLGLAILAWPSVSALAGAQPPEPEAPQPMSIPGKGPVGSVEYIKHETCMFQTALRPRNIYPHFEDLPFSVPGVNTDPGAATGMECAALCEQVPDAATALFYAPDSSFKTFKQGSTKSLDGTEPGLLDSYKAIPYHYEDIKYFMKKKYKIRNLPEQVIKGFCECRTQKCAESQMRFAPDKETHDMGTGGGIYVLGSAQEPLDDEDKDL